MHYIHTANMEEGEMSELAGVLISVFAILLI